MVAGVAPLIVIVGVTASGKTDFAIKVAKKYNGEVVCADSRTIYKRMDIGTAKPSLTEMHGVKHYLINVVEPDEIFTAADFKARAQKCIDDIWSKGKMPILVGGSGLYVNSIIYDYEFSDKVSNELREELNSLSVEELQNRCNELGISLPENRTNKRYLMRAIEVNGASKNNNVVRDNTIIVGISIDKEEVRQRVEERIEQMFQKGVVEEAIELAKNFGWDSEPMKSNIYRVVRKYSEGEISLGEAKQQAVSADMRLVKKQLTWFKRNKSIKWGSPKNLIGYIGNFVKNIN